MKKIKVDLTHFTPSHVVVEAVGMPHNLTNPTIEIATNVIAELSHTSVAEHVVFSFKIKGISRACLAELSRHRIASMTVQSTRYSLHKMLKELEMIDKQSELQSDFFEKYYVQADFEEIKDYPSHWKLRSHNLASIAQMERMRENGFKADDYKYFITENLRVNLSLTINLRSMLNFLKLRLDKSAHKEIRHLAGLIKSEICRIPYVNQIIKRIDNKNEELQTKIDFYDDMSKIIVDYASSIDITDHWFHEKSFTDNLKICIAQYFNMRRINYEKTYNILDYKK